MPLYKYKVSFLQICFSTDGTNASGFTSNSKEFKVGTLASLSDHQTVIWDQNFQFPYHQRVEKHNFGLDKKSYLTWRVSNP